MSEAVALEVLDLDNVIIKIGSKLYRIVNQEEEPGHKLREYRAPDGSRFICLMLEEIPEAGE